MTVTYENNKIVIENISADFGKKIMNFIYAGNKEKSTEKILPRPVMRDGNGKLAKDYSSRDWYLKLQEEIFETVEDSFNQPVKTAEEIADVITVCISWLEAFGYDEEKRSELFAKVNEKNKKRGYFKECDENVD